MNRKIALFLFIVVIAGSFWVLQRNIKTPSVYADRFNGQIREVREDLLIIEGVFFDSSTQKILSGRSVNVEAKVTSQTKFTKILLYMPTVKDLEKTNRRWNPSDLKQEYKTSSLDEVRNTEVKGLPVAVKITKVAIDSNKFDASEVEFTEQIYSD